MTMYAPVGSCANWGPALLLGKARKAQGTQGPRRQDDKTRRDVTCLVEVIARDAPHKHVACHRQSATWQCGSADGTCHVAEWTYLVTTVFIYNCKKTVYRTAAERDGGVALQQQERGTVGGAAALQQQQDKSLKTRRRWKANAADAVVWRRATAPRT